MRTTVMSLMLVLSLPAAAQAVPDSPDGAGQSAASVLGISSGALPNASSPDSSKPIKADDFVRAIDAADTFASQSAELAQMHSKDPKVLAYARTVIERFQAFKSAIVAVDVTRAQLVSRTGPGSTDYSGATSKLTVVAAGGPIDAAYVASARHVQRRILALLQGFAERGERSSGFGERVTRRLRERAESLVPQAEQALAAAEALPAR